ncbi:hypothetical protein INT47_007783 [Mucor saturninus]|uniref:Sorting nexin MVP1 n=1 Tax=Mucor saturninus TaxID=64648 RepID=A0A8H7RCZ6_9FUNG|nr:hypothetical protein INT47_007783 [Mucor saturninus]
MADELAGSSFLGTNNYFMPESRSISFAVEEDPWSAAGFDPVDEMRQPLHQTQAMDEDMVTEGITAANVLVGVDLPEIFDTAYIRAGPVGDRVSIDSLQVIIGLGGLGPRLYEQISAMIVPSGAMYVTRNEFNTALALLGCAQKNMDLSLVKVYQHRNDLPVPLLSNLETVSIKRVNPLMTSSKPKSTGYDDDPWRVSSTPPRNDFPVYQDVPIKRSIAPKPMIVQPVADRHIDKVSTQALVKASTESYQWFLDLDQITVAVAEKEGFLFTHVNYWVHSTQRQTSVRRRYSDFYWFWETLLKRYPFRVVPNLPPKKISGKDKAFLEKRCQGLSRFINCVVRHPVLKNDEEVISFLTEQTEFVAWRRAKSPLVDEEFVRLNPHTEDLESFIPKDLNDRLNEMKKRVPQSIEKYDELCNVMDRCIRLKEARALEMKKYNNTLKELSEIEHVCFVADCQACTQVVRGYESVGTYMSEASTIIELDVASATTGVLENLKRHRDISIAFLEMLERKGRLESNQISTLYKKVSANKAKVNQNRGVPGLESEVARLDAVIKSDSEQLTYQQRRDTYIQYCVATEASYLHKQQSFVSLLYQNFVHEQLQYARRSVDNWKALEAVLCEMPKPEDFA